MKRDIALSGMIGLTLDACIFFLANWLASFLPTLATGFITTTVVFVIILIVALVEMPIMVVAIRILSTTAITRRIIQGSFAIYVSFASIYALMFILLAGNGYPWLGIVLAALGLVRFASGVFIR